MSGSGIAVLVAAAVLGLAPLSPPLVERLYSRGVYAVWQPVATFISNAAPVALFDVIAAAIVLAIVVLTIRDLSRVGRRRAAIRGFARLTIWAAAAYLVFLATWGLNYRRQRLVDRLPYDGSAVTDAAAARLATDAVERLNALHGVAHAEGWVNGSAIDPALAGAFERTIRDLDLSPRGIVVGRPKRSLLDWYFRRAGVSGMTDPFLLETLLAGDLLPFERPFVAAHEWNHLANLAHEGEANYAGWLTCLRGSAGNQYSGWLFMYGEAFAAAPANQRSAIASRLEAGPRADLRAIRERNLRNVDPRVSAAGWRVYDSYLKANRIEGGAASYDEVIRLALGLKMQRPAE